MARRESYRDLKFRADAAEKREDMKRQARIAAPKPYRARPDRQSAFYRSLLVEDTIFKIDIISQNAQALLTGSPADTPVAGGSFASLGLLGTLAAGESALSMRGTGRRPSRLSWFNGDSTPRQYTTPWGTRVVAWGDKTGTGEDAQSHRSCPVGDPSSPVTFDGVRLVVTALLTTAVKNTILGTKGQITLIPETGNTPFT